MSSFFDEASLVMIPSGYKNQKVYSVKPLDGSGDLTFSRASDATRVASNGLIEKVRTNVLLQSNTFSAWTASNATVTSGQAGYDGTNTAWLIKGDTTTSRHNVFRSNPLAGEQTLSIYAKAGGHSFLQIAMATTADQYANFDLSTGTIGNAGIDFFNAQITSVGNGWYRISALTLSAGNIYISLVSSKTAGWLESWAMPNNTDGVLIMNSQLEAGVLTEFIGNTTTTAVSVGPVSGLPRLDYLNSSCPRLLLEPQRTNGTLYSEQFDNAAWSIIEATITSNTTATLDPTGYYGADKLVESSTNNQHVVFQSSDGTSATYSFFAKAAGRDWVAVLSNNGGHSFFNIANGTLGTIQSGSTATITSYGNGWYRCTLYNTHPSFGATIYLAFANANHVYQGNGTSGAYIYGAQLEASSAYATSYIPTLGTSVTRVADAASKTGISSLIGQTEGTLFVDATLTNVIDTVNLRGLIELNDGTTNNRFSIYRGANTTDVTALVFTTSTTKSATLSSTGRTKIAIGYDASGISFYFNGTLVATETPITYPACSELDLGIISNNTNRILGDGINQALLFKTRLTNAQLAELTAL
jgi:hypothetical protein